MKVESAPPPVVRVSGARLLIAAAPYYREVVGPLIEGAARAIAAAGGAHEVVEVPGAFELPAAILATESAQCGFDGYVALGCVVRGETSHYDYVCGETARGIMELSLRGLVIGFGLLTVENLDQARVRAALDQGDKGGEAARAALALIAYKRQIAGQSR